MIKFFRKICQKLLSKNNFSKYLLRVIGEIIGYQMFKNIKTRIL